VACQLDFKALCRPADERVADCIALETPMKGESHRTTNLGLRHQQLFLQSLSQQTMARTQSSVFTNQHAREKRGPVNRI